MNEFFKQLDHMDEPYLIAEIGINHNGEIINADSMQVYKELKILTARPLKKEDKLFAYDMCNVFNLCLTSNIETKKFLYQ